MAEISTQNVRIDDRNMRRFVREVRGGIDRGGQTPEIDRAWTGIATVYLETERRRALANSRGAGEWPPLKPATIRRRRRGGPRRGGSRVVERRGRRTATALSAAILRDTGTLLRAMEPGSPGNVIRRVRDGVEVGFEGGSHPDARMTIGQLAAIHNFGLGNNPERRLLHDPSRGVVRQAGRIMANAIGGIAGRMGRN